MLSVQNMFYRPKEKHDQADSKAKFHQPEGDHLMLLTVVEGEPIFEPMVPHMKVMLLGK